MRRGLRLTIRLPKAPDALPGKDATLLLAWVCNDLMEVVDRAPVPVDLVLEPDPKD